MCVCVCRGPVWEEICSLGPTPAHCRPSGAEDEVQRPGSTLAPKNLQVLQGLGVWFDQPGLVFAEHLDFGVLPDGPPGSDCCLQSRTGSWHSLLQCCNACSWTHLSSSSKIQRNCMGLKITVCMGRWGKYLNPKELEQHFQLNTKERCRGGWQSRCGRLAGKKGKICYADLTGCLLH